jgi:hypothetical protein
MAFVFITLVGIWVIYSMVRAYRLSGYRFYLTTGLVAGIPYVLRALVFYYAPSLVLILFLVVLVLSRIGPEWGKDQEEKAERDDPSRWAEWRSKRSKRNLIDRLFL